MSVISKVSYSLYSQNEINATDININHVKADDESGTVKDSRLGATDGVLCKTCNRTELECFGHWGKVRIYENIIIRPEYINEVLRIQNHICLTCGLLRSREPYTIKDISALSSAEIRKLKDKISSKKKSCWNSRCMQPYQKINFSKKKVCLVNKTDEFCVPNALVYEKLTSIHPKFWPILDIHQDPCNLFYKGYFPIPPLLIRPVTSFWTDNVHKDTNELTYLLGVIVKHCNANADEPTIEKAIIEYDNIKLISTNSTTNNLSYITSGKTNMLRSFVVARRKDQTARSVLGPDSSLDISEVGIPDYMRNTLTERIFINAFTIDKVKDLFQKGEVKYYFNKRLHQLTKIKQNRFIKNKIHLLPGDWVETNIQEYTNIIFGRQPSLHKYNVISSSVRKTAEDTIKIPPGIANSQNADFDGDEEWTIVEQNPKSIVEQSILMYPTTILKHDIHGMPVYGSIQDEILAAYDLFKKENLTKDEVLNILGKYGLEFITDYESKKVYTGKDVFKFIINEPDINYPGILSNGELIVDNIDSNFIVAMKHMSISGLITDYKSSIEGIRFINKASYVFKRYLKIYGFSITFRNLCPDFEFTKKLRDANMEKINIIKAAYSQYLYDVANGSIIPLSRSDEMEAVDSILSGLTNFNIQEIEKYMKEVVVKDPENSLIKMSCAGYKVNPTELMYILGTYGQQRIDGEPIDTRILGRVLPYFLPDSKDPEGKGYILNSLIQGLTGSQYYYAMLIARSQSTDIVCETSRTGTLARKIIKKMEDMVVDGYGQVVYNNTLVKYAANYTKIQGSVCKSVELIYPDESLTWFLEISALWDKLKNGFIYNQGQKISKYILAPFNFKVFIKSDEKKPMKPKDLYDKIQIVIKDIRENYFFDISNIDFIEYVFLTHLNPSRVKVSEDTLNTIFDKLYEKLNYSLGGGLPIGIISAQVLSEKFTQQALSSFHTTEKSGGIKRKLGFNEFNQLTNLSKNKSEIITLISDDITKLQTIKMNFEFVYLGELNPEITIKEDKDYYRIDIDINRLYIKRNQLTELIVEYMLEKFVSYSVLVKNWGMETNIVNEYIIRFSLFIVFTEPLGINKNKFMMVLPGAANKGKVSKYKIPISKYRTYIDHDRTKESYRLTVELMGLKELGTFDLINVNVIPGVWNTYEIFGIESVKSYLCEALLNTYGEGLDYLYQPCDLLASLICLNYEPESINKFKFGPVSALKRATFGDNKALLNAALYKKTEPVNDNSSCHFFSKVPKIGTGYYKYFMDIEKFLRFKKKISEKLTEKKIADIGESVQDF
ncbi:CRPV-232 [Crowpox virus]|nr:CRPV-232 [Crowpox virus]